MSNVSTQQAWNAEDVIQSLSAPLLEISQHLAAEFQELESAVAERDRAWDEMQSAVDAGQRRIAELEAMVVDLQQTKGRVSLLEESLCQAEARADKLAAERAEFERLADERGGVLDELRSTIDLGLRRMVELEALAEQIGTERDELGRKLSERDGTLNRMQSTIEDRDRVIAELEVVAQQVAQLKADVVFHLGQNTTLRKDLNGLGERLKDAEDRRSKLDDLLHRLAPKLQLATYDARGAEPQEPVSATKPVELAGKGRAATRRGRQRKGSIIGASE
ncbi:hypothetical protein BH10PSE13_BH10PSE13_00030 [soil metagenome]